MSPIWSWRDDYDGSACIHEGPYWNRNDLYKFSVVFYRVDLAVVMMKHKWVYGYV